MASGVVLGNPVAIAPAGDVCQPVAVVQIPADGLFDAVLKAFRGRPSQSVPQVAGIDRVALVMARAVGDEGNQARIGLPVAPWAQAIKHCAKRMDEVKVAPLGIAADHPGFAGGASFQYGPNGGAVIADMQPVAHVAPIPIDRDRFTRQRAVNREWNEFFRKLERAVIVRTVGDQGRQPVGMVPGTHQMVARCLGRAVRAVRCIRRMLVKRWVLGAQRAEYFVGGDVQESESTALVQGESIPEVAGLFKQGMCAHHIGADECVGFGDRAIDMAFSSKMNHGPGLVLREQRAHQRSITNIANDQFEAGIGRQRVEVGRIGCIRQLIQNNNRFAGGGNGIEDEICADKSGAASDEKHGGTAQEA